MNDGKTPMRVLHVLGCLDRGGAETLVMNLYRNIDRTRIQFDFVVHRKGAQAYTEEALALGGKCYCCPRYKVFNHFRYKRWWHRFFKAHPEDLIVHGHLPNTASIYLKIAKKYGRLTIAHSHSTSSGRGLAAMVKELLQHSIRKRADFFMGCSNEANRWLFGEEVAGNKEKCIVFKNGIDTARYKYDEKLRCEKRRELNVSDDLVLGTVGRMEEPKNPLFIVDVVSEAAKIRPNIKCLWVGNGSMRQAVERKISDLSLNGRFIFVGCVDNVSDYLQAMDLFLLPSLWEGLGVSLLEAQSSGLPCVCSDVVPDEGIVTDLVAKISLREKPGTWARECVGKSKEIRRDDAFSIVKRGGFDIQASVRRLCEVYAALIQNQQ